MEPDFSTISFEATEYEKPTNVNFFSSLPSAKILTPYFGARLIIFFLIKSAIVTVDFKAEKGVTLEVGENQTIVVKGMDRSLVGLTAAKIHKLKKPEPYKGKGIKYTGEVIRRKAGKAAKTAK